MSIAEKLTAIAENVSKVFIAGRKAECDYFWNNYQDNGNRTDYANAFAGKGWNIDTFKPKHNIKPTTCYMMFRQCAVPEIWDMMDSLGVTLDTSLSNNFQYFFYSPLATTMRMGVINVINAKFMQQAFYSSTLETIEKIISSVDTVWASNTFSGGLKNTTFEGEIGCSINFQATQNLSEDSMISALTHLVDYSETESAGMYSIKFNDDCWDRLNSYTIQPDDGSSWQQYALNKGWTT